MTWTSDAQLDDFVARFRERTLPKSEWTHAAHLSVGAWHVHRYGVEEAVNRLRQGIRALNDSHGTANTDSSGYHETITRAYAHLIAEFLSEQREVRLPIGWELCWRARWPTRTRCWRTTRGAC